MRVLLVEDESRIADFVAQGLREQGYAVDVASTGDEALDWTEAAVFDLIILDVMLPIRDGVEVCLTLRQRGVSTPVLMLTAKDTVEDRVRGLDSGADDYLVKPFAFDELCARLRALIRRRYETKNPCMQLGALSINTDLRQIFDGDTPVALTRNEYMLVEYLALRRGRVLSRHQVREHLYPHDVDVSSNVIEVMIYNIRKKLRTQGLPSVIRTIRGHGYLID